jgi:hypothetical protein
MFPRDPAERPITVSESRYAVAAGAIAAEAARVRAR